METKQLIDKFIKGEITEEEFDTETSKLTPEEKIQLEKDAEDKKGDAVEILKGVRRGINKIAGKKEEEDANLTTKIKEENLETAKAKFFSEYGIEKEEDKASFEEGFKTGSVNVDNIIKDMKSHFVSKNPDHYLNLEKEKKAREKEAEDFTANNAGAGGSNGGGQDNTKVSKEVKDFIAESAKVGRNITPEQAQRAIDIRNRRGHISTV